MEGQGQRGELILIRPKGIPMSERLRVGMRVLHPKYGEGVIYLPYDGLKSNYWVNYGEAPIIQVLEDRDDLRKYRKIYRRQAEGLRRNEMSVSSGVWRGLLIAGAILGAIWLFGALTADAADLKCVTVKFKNDSELKLKTQWFANGCDTTVVVDTVREHGYWWEHRDTDTWSFIPNDTCETYEISYFPKRYITCRTLLFPPDIRKEPSIKRKYNADGSWDTVVIVGEINEDGWQRQYMIPACDTIPGEALLWYEETKP